ncbi:LysR substrate-binding domain-containing protein [Sphingomonas oryzagri]
MPHLPEFEAWAIFAKVAEVGSFSQAAAELGLAKTTVSKAVTRLEERMRTTLIQRTTRQLNLTESGRLCLERASRILADGVGVEAEILEEAAIPRGLIRMSTTTAFGVEALAPLLPEFLRAYPDIEIDLCLTDGKIDIVADSLDCAIRIGGLADSSLRVSRLFSFRRPLVAGPSFIARYGRPAHPSDLSVLPAIIPSHVPWGAEWEFSHPSEGSYSVSVRGPLKVNNGTAMVPSLLAGLGMATYPEFYIWDHLQEGRLEELLPEWKTAPGPIYVVTPPGRARPARVRVLLSFLREHFSTKPWAHGVET